QTGNALDGEWSQGASTFPSGDGVPGGDFRFRFNVVPGDVNRNGGVNAQDVILTRNRQGSSVAAPANYSVFYDVNGNGGINGQDLILVRNRQGAVLPVGEPSLGTVSSLVFAASGEVLTGSTELNLSPTITAKTSADGLAPSIDAAALTGETITAASVEAGGFAAAPAPSALLPSAAQARHGQHVQVSSKAHVEPGVVLADHVRVRARSRIGAGTYVSERVRIAEDVSLGADGYVGA